MACWLCLGRFQGKGELKTRVALFKACREGKRDKFSSSFCSGSTTPSVCVSVVREGAGAPESLCVSGAQTRAVVEQWLGKKAGSLSVRRIVELFSELLCFCCELGCAQAIHSNDWRDKEQFMCKHCCSLMSGFYATAFSLSSSPRCEPDPCKPVINTLKERGNIRIQTTCGVKFYLQ